MIEQTLRLSCDATDFKDAVNTLKLFASACAEAERNSKGLDATARKAGRSVLGTSKLASELERKTVSANGSAWRTFETVPLPGGADRIEVPGTGGGNTSETLEEAAAATVKWAATTSGAYDQVALAVEAHATGLSEVLESRVWPALEKDASEIAEWAKGAVKAFDEYESRAGNAADNVAKVTAHAMRGMENGFVGVILGTRSVSEAFSDMADSILSDVARMVVRETITAPLAGLISGSIQNLFSPSSSSDSGSGSGLFGLFGVGHAGGMIGGPNSFAERAVPASVFTGARRFHGGGMPGLGVGEVPLIAQRGEVIGWPNQLRQAFGGSQGGGTVVNIIDQRGGGAPAVEVNRQSAGAGGSEQIDIIIRDLEQRLGRNISRGGGLAPVLRREFGLRHVGVR